MEAYFGEDSVSRERVHGSVEVKAHVHTPTSLQGIDGCAKQEQGGDDGVHG